MKGPAIDVLGPLRCERGPGESLYETARRCITLQLLNETGGNQKEAAERAGVAPRVINHYCRDLRARPIDAKAAGGENGFAELA